MKITRVLTPVKHPQSWPHFPEGETETQRGQNELECKPGTGPTSQ